MTLYNLQIGNRGNSQIIVPIQTNANINRYAGYNRYHVGMNLISHNSGQADDPILKEVNKSINFGIKNGLGVLIIKFTNNGWPLIIVKSKGYYINGYKKNKGEVNNIVSYMIKRHTDNNMDYDSAEKQFNNMINTSLEITKCIINKLFYQYISEDKMHNAVGITPVVDTLLTVEKTSRQTTAIEINSGLWINMEDKLFCQFIKACNGSKNKFYGISPEELYYTCTGKILSSNNVKLVRAFLSQNRHKDLIAKKSMELFEGLCTRFPNKIKKVDISDSGCIGLLVKGYQYDWVIVGPEDSIENGTTGQQNVSTYILLNSDNFIANKDKDGDTTYETVEGCNLPRSWGSRINGKYIVIGSICIDQTQYDISIGDQFAARALAVMNDKTTLSIVSTLRSYSQYTVAHRVDFDAVSELHIR